MSVLLVFPKLIGWPTPLLFNASTWAHHPYIICSKRLPPAPKCWHYVAYRTFSEQRDSDCSLVLDASSQFVDI